MQGGPPLSSFVPLSRNTLRSLFHGDPRCFSTPLENAGDSGDSGDVELKSIFCNALRVTGLPVERISGTGDSGDSGRWRERRRAGTSIPRA